MITLLKDPGRRRLTLVLEGDVTGAELVRDKLAVADETATWDYVYDLARYTGILGHDDIARLAAGWASIVQGRDKGCATVLVTTDPGFRLWAGVFPMQFPGRRFLLLDSMAEVDAALSQAGPARSC